MWWMFRFVIFLAFSSVLALAAHKMQRRYALALSIMSYRQIRARQIASEIKAGRSGVEAKDFDESYKTLSEHLRFIRGSPPDKPALFDTIPNLPRKINGAADLKWLNAFHQARSW